MSDINNSKLLWKEELSKLCKSKSLSEEGIRKIIERDGLTPNKTRISDDYKFFLDACRNKRVTEGIIQCLLEYFPDAASAAITHGKVPLHYACKNKSVSIGKIVKLLMDAAPDSVRNVTDKGHMPLHTLCGNKKMDEAASMHILKLLIEKHPEAVRHADRGGRLPIHFAAGTKSPEFCRLLIEAYPGSEQIPDAKGSLPLHLACGDNSLATVEYLYRQYPDAINHAATTGFYPIHDAIDTEDRETPAAAVEIVRFLLDCDPNQKLKQHEGESLLHYACGIEHNDSNIEASIQIIKILFNADPDSVRSVTNEGLMPLHTLCGNNEMDEAASMQILKLLIEKHPEAIRHADSDDDLPIHIAARTKSPEFCRLLIEAYPESEQIPDADGALPLHLACEDNSLATVEYLYRQYPDAINHATTTGFYPIHYAIYTEDRETPAGAVEIVRFLLDCDPNQKLKQHEGRSLLHCACGIEHNDSNREAGIQIIKILFNADPDSVRSVTDEGLMPLHTLCGNKKMDEAAAIHILKLLIEKHPEAIRHADSGGGLPIYFAAGTKSPEFCRLLIEAYPGSEQIPDANGLLPLHVACAQNSLPTVEYLYRQYPDAINHATTNGFYPIHNAISFERGRETPAGAVEIVRFLLDCDPNQKLKHHEGESLLHYACEGEYNDSNIEASIQIIKILFDAHPEAIENYINYIIATATGIERFHHQVQVFIIGELVYACQAKDHRLMMTPDAHGQLPLHRALQNNVRLGSIKLLVKGNPSAIRNSDINLAMPLHIACEHHDSASIVQYLLDLDTRTRRAVDIDNNTALHYACRGKKHDTITLLLKTYDAESVSRRNAHGKLPIDMLWESIEVSNRESLKYTESVFQLLRVYPEMLTIRNWAEKQPSIADATRNGKKRKFGQE
eukprot:scaffold2472_cov132-Skeletonema_menzelii.AAC.7